MKHSCKASVAKEHPIKAVKSLPQYHRVEGRRCMCHGHCGACMKAVMMCKMGKYHHIEVY